RRLRRGAGALPIPQVKERDAPRDDRGRQQSPEEGAEDLEWQEVHEEGSGAFKARLAPSAIPMPSTCPGLSRRAGGRNVPPGPSARRGRGDRNRARPRSKPSRPAVERRGERLEVGAAPQRAQVLLLGEEAAVRLRREVAQRLRHAQLPQRLPGQLVL